MPLSTTERPDSITSAEIRLDRLRSNARVMLERAAPASILAVVKADAYGHGAVQCVRALSLEGIDFFAVATLAEAATLREAGIDARVFVLAAPLSEQLAWYERLDVDMTVADLKTVHQITELFRRGQPLRIHVKVDTGMSRLGLSSDEFLKAARILRREHIPVEGLWTHYASADDPTDPQTERQRRLFESLVSESGLEARYVHAANTGSLIAGSGTVPFGNLVRLGISLYGAPGFKTAVDTKLRPVMSLRSRVVQIRAIPPGTGVSYGHRFVSSGQTRIATVGAGYADGYPRVMTRSPEVGIRGRRYRVAGTVCMDMLMADIRTSDEIVEGDVVTLFGDGGPTPEEVADWAGTIPYELFCRVGKRVPRVYLNGDIGSMG